MDACLATRSADCGLLSNIAPSLAMCLPHSKHAAVLSVALRVFVLGCVAVYHVAVPLLCDPLSSVGSAGKWHIFEEACWEVEGLQRYVAGLAENDLGQDRHLFERGTRNSVYWEQLRECHPVSRRFVGCSFLLGPRATSRSSTLAGAASPLGHACSYGLAPVYHRSPWRSAGEVPTRGRVGATDSSADSSFHVSFAWWDGKEDKGENASCGMV